MDWEKRVRVSKLVRLHLRGRCAGAHLSFDGRQILS